MIIHTRIKYSILLITPLILLILLLAVSAANDNRISEENSKSIEAFKQALRINPDDTEVHIKLGVVYVISDMYEEAIEAHKQVVRIKPDSVAAHCWLGLIYVSLNDKGSALEQYKILKRLDHERANELYSMIH